MFAVGACTGCVCLQVHRNHYNACSLYDPLAAVLLSEHQR
jgi:hypothetical protein